MFGLIGAVIIGAVLGWLSERQRYTRMGEVPAITTAIGGAVVARLLYGLFGLGIFGGAVTAALGAALALWLAPRLRKR